MTGNKISVAVIAGPTASGKTAASLIQAQRLSAEIVSADSIQVYRYLDIGSAKPSQGEMAQVPHHMIDIRDPNEEFSAGDYVREARTCIAHIASRGHVPMVVGGTGLYVRTLLGGIADLPPADLDLRRQMHAQEKQAPGSLRERLEAVDPDTAHSVPAENISRTIRALEVFDRTGKRLSDLQKEHKFHDRPYRSLFLCLNPPRKVLYERIDQRVDSMIKGGLLDEVRELYARGFDRRLKPLQSLGYRHAGMVLNAELDLPEATRLMKRDTRRYAKRQLTWFGSEPEVIWCDPEDVSGIGFLVDRFLGR